MNTCPRDGAELTPIYTESKSIRTGQRVAREPVLSGWYCTEHGNLNFGEQPVVVEE